MTTTGKTWWGAGVKRAIWGFFKWYLIIAFTLAVGRGVATLASGA